MEADRASQILGVSAGATADEVKVAFRKLVRAHHPDVTGDSRLATARTADLIEAYRVLRATIAGVDPDLAAADARADRPPTHAPAHPRPQAPSRPGSGGGLQSEHVVRRLDRSKGVRVTVDGDTIAAPVPSNEMFAALFEAAHGLGEVAYTDRSVGLLEIIVEFEDGPVCSVLLTLQGRAAGGITEAFVTVEPLTQEAAPPAAAVARLVASRLRAHLR